jgi:hypothetical protein
MLRFMVEIVIADAAFGEESSGDDVARKLVEAAEAVRGLGLQRGLYGAWRDDEGNSVVWLVDV